MAPERAATAPALPPKSPSSPSERMAQLLADSVPVAAWSIRDVGDRIELIGLHQYRKSFVSKGVDGNVLLKMNAGILEHLGIRSLGHQHRIIEEVEKLKELAFDPGESEKESHPKHQVVQLVKRQQDLADKVKCLKDVNVLLNDLAKTGLFGKLGQAVKTLGMEGGKELVTQVYDSICQLKTKLAEAEQDLFEKRAALNLEGSKAAGMLGCSHADLFKSLSSCVSMPSLAPPRSLDKDALEALAGRLHPDPKVIKAAKKKRAEEEAKAPKRFLTSEELDEQHGRLYPDPAAQKQKWKQRELDQDLEVKKMVARGTFDMPPETRRELIDGFHERWKVDVQKRGIG